MRYGIPLLLILVGLSVIVNCLVKLWGAQGPDSACIVDETTLRYEPGTPWSGDSPLPTGSVEVRVGCKGSPLERLETITQLEAGTWRVTFSNTVTGHTGEQTLLTCQEKP